MPDYDAINAHRPAPPPQYKSLRTTPPACIQSVLDKCPRLFFDICTSPPVTHSVYQYSVPIQCVVQNEDFMRRPIYLSIYLFLRPRRLPTVCDIRPCKTLVRGEIFGLTFLLAAILGILVGFLPGWVAGWVHPNAMGS